MNTKLLTLTLSLMCAFSNSYAMTKIEYKTQKDMISGQYKVSRDKCNNLKANAKDICVSEAKGAQNVAEAELQSSYEPSARHIHKVATAKSDAAYETAKQRCDDSRANTKSICMADAKALHVKSTDEARVMRVSSETEKFNAGVRSMANKDENEANFKAARARCDSMSGSTHDACVSDAKVKYNMK